MATSYSLLYHCWIFSLKPLKSGSTTEYVDYPVTNGKMARGTDFEPNVEFNTEDYEGHSGIKTLTLQSDRVSVTAEPQYSHGVVFGECLEEYCYMITGSYEDLIDAATGEEPTEDTEAFKWVFYQDLANPKPLPFATLINQYKATLRDAIVYDNAMMSEFGITIDDKGVSCSVKFKSDAPLMNQPNQTSTTVPLRKLGKQDIKMYIAPVDVTLTDSNKAQYAYDCIISNELTFNTNPEDSTCLNTEFGKNSSDEGTFESSGKAEIKWNPKSAFLIDEYYSGAGKYHGVKPTVEPLFKQILIEAKGGKITTVGSGATAKDIHCELDIHLPYVEITKCDTPESGSEKKTINIEYAHRVDLANPTESPVKFTIVTPVGELAFGEQLTIDKSKEGISTIEGIDL